MAKITRKTAQVFGLTAGTDQIAQFGSLEAASPIFSTDPVVIQALSNWSEGWFEAVEDVNSPAIEDMNAYCYVTSYQIAYALQTGVPEWDNGTTYFIGSIAQNGSGVLYLSLTNNNLNNALTDTGNWSPLNIGGNAATATKLLNARTINGVSFDGSANIVVTAAAGTVTGTTLASNVVTSSLTALGVLSSLNVSGSANLATSSGQLNVGQTGNTQNLFLNNTDVGSLYISGGTGANTAAGIVLFGGSNGGNPSLLEIFVNSNTVIAIPQSGAVQIGAVSGTQAHTVNGTMAHTLQVAIGAISTSAHFNISGASPLTGVTQYGYQSSFTGTSAATTAIRGFSASNSTAAASFTCAAVTNFESGNVTVGAGSTVTAFTGFHDAGAANHRATNNASFADNVSFTGNWFLNQSGTDPSQISGILTIGSGTTQQHKLNTLLGTNASGILTLTNAPSGVSGNPTGYIEITVNGSTGHFIPYW